MFFPFQVFLKFMDIQRNKIIIPCGPSRGLKMGPGLSCDEGDNLVKKLPDHSFNFHLNFKKIFKKV